MIVLCRLSIIVLQQSTQPLAATSIAPLWQFIERQSTHTGNPRQQFLGRSSAGHAIHPGLQGCEFSKMPNVLLRLGLPSFLHPGGRPIDVEDIDQ